jgi:hypothetical protein
VKCVLKPITTVFSFFARALRQYHDRPFEMAAAGYQYPENPGKPQSTAVSEPELGPLAKGT